MSVNVNRRTVLVGAGAALAAGIFALQPGRAATTYAVTMSNQDWHKKLSPEQYAVLREKATEPAGTSPLLEEHRSGMFVCAACQNELFSSKTKFESGTGWPSFYEPINTHAVATTTDYEIGMPRTEVHCARCGGHLGHVFDDGPAPTHQRYCMNGVALKFEPGKTA